MKLKNAPIRSTVKINGNIGKVLSHGIMGCRVDILKSKDDSISVGKTILSNESEVSYDKRTV